MYFYTTLSSYSYCLLCRWVNIPEWWVNINRIYRNDIKKVQASNLSNQRINYSIEAKEGLVELTFYRIKEVDMDLKFFYSSIKSLRRETNQTFYTIEGNYVRNKMLKIHSTVAGTFRLMNHEGKLVYSRVISKGGSQSFAGIFAYRLLFNSICK